MCVLASAWFLSVDLPALAAKTAAEISFDPVTSILEVWGTPAGIATLISGWYFLWEGARSLTAWSKKRLLWNLAVRRFGEDAIVQALKPKPS